MVIWSTIPRCFEMKDPQWIPSTVTNRSTRGRDFLDDLGPLWTQASCSSNFENSFRLFYSLCKSLVLVFLNEEGEKMEFRRPCWAGRREAKRGWGCQGRAKERKGERADFGWKCEDCSPSIIEKFGFSECLCLGLCVGLCLDLGHQTLLFSLLQQQPTSSSENVQKFYPKYLRILKEPF